MPTIPDENQTTSLNLIDTLDMDLHTVAQTMLAPVHEYFPFLSFSLFDIPLGNFLMAVVVFFFFYFYVNCLATSYLFFC